MTGEDTKLYNLTRRKVLGGLTGVGLAAAGAGIGTSAYFSDEETFKNNRLVAGELDLKVDWEEHYSDWSDDESTGLSNDVLMSQPGTPEDYTPLPDPQQPLIWVHDDDLDRFMANTAVEAFPDPNNDSRQGANGFNYDPCGMGADTPADLDPTVDGALRSLNDDTVIGPVDSPEGPAPLVNLQDVKPGDFGEITFSLHLCGNPGYIWAQGRPVLAAENGHAEPEAKDTDEAGPPEEAYDVRAEDTVADVLDADVELLDAIKTLWWYDSIGDNVPQVDCPETLYLTDSGTDPTTLFAVDLVDDANGNPDHAELTELWPNGDAVSGFDQTDAIAATPDGDAVIFYDKHSGRLGRYDVSADSFTDVGAIAGDPGGVVLAGYSPTGTLWAASQDTDQLYTVDPTGPTAAAQGSTGIDLQGADLAFASDGTLFIWTADADDQGLYKVADPVSDTTAVPVDPSTIGTQNTTITGLAIRDAGTGDLVASDRANNDIVVLDRGEGDVEVRYEMRLAGEMSEYQYDFGDMTAGRLCGEVFRRGTLREDLRALSSGNGLPLDGDLTTAFDEVAGDAASPDRECFDPSETHYVGFAWYLPIDHGNELQTDAVGFDIGFYTEQCRHNDGSGLDQEQNLSTGHAEWMVVETPDQDTALPWPAQVVQPHDRWVTAGCASWVDPYGDGSNGDSDPVGSYTYELTFDVERTSDLEITKFSSDNPVTLYLDGTQIGQLSDSRAYETFGGPITESGLAVGSHTLRAEVENDPGGGDNPTGLIVCAELQ